MSNADWPGLVHLAYPGFLAALALVPIVVALGLRSLSGLSRVRGPLAIGLRCLVVAVVVLALASPEWVRTTDDQTVAFAIDQSDSVPGAQREAAQEFIRQASAEMRPGKDRVAVLAFDGRASVEQVAGPELVTDGVSGPLEPHRTNVAGAMRLGLALLPAESARRLVFLTDGNENVGSAAQEAQSCGALGIPVDVLPLRYEHDAEMLVDQLTAPAGATRGETVSLRLVIRSQAAAGAHVHLYHNDRLVNFDASDAQAGWPVQLHAGPNRFSIPIELRASGVHRFRAVLEPDSPATDTLACNNEGRAFTIVGEAERVLIVTDTAVDPEGINEASATALRRALEDGGIECEQIEVDELPADPAVLADTSTVILSNVSAFALGDARQQILVSYVRDQGGGLIVLGGDQAFSVGGYAHTPLEQILPVETARDKLKLLSLAMVIVIDRSGSMVGEKISMARQAAVASVRLLSRLDRVGVVAFNDAAEWIVPLQPAGDAAAIARQIDVIGAGGGTDMYPALQQAQAALADADANLKHIIVLTDGQSAPAAFDALARRCGADGITVSTIAVGPDADLSLLARIAQLSGGRMYAAESGRPLPQILARETVLASRSGIFERTFTPRLRAVNDSPILEGFAQADIPPLRGQVVSAAKPLAQTPLVRATEEGHDPVLAHWQVGLGRVVAFTGGLWPKWGPEWVAWPGFSKVWTQAARYAGRPGNPSELQIEATVREGAGRVVVSTEHLAFGRQNSLMISGQLVHPDFSSEVLPLQRTAVDRFEATFPAEAPGTYLASVFYAYGDGADGSSGVLRAGAVVSYSPEYRSLRDNHNLLSEVARETQGRVLNLNYPEAVFESSSIRPVQVRQPFWEELVRLGLVIFLLDVAVRRIAVTPVEVLRRVRNFIHEAVGRPVAEDTAVTLATLRGVKVRMREEASAAPDETGGAAPAPGGEQGADALTRALSGAAADAPVVYPPASKRRPPATSEHEYTARLLRAKKRARGSDPERRA